jgi:hypothetical protein
VSFVFYDEWYRHETVGRDGHEALESMYSQADLIVPFFSEYYQKPWCKLEWAIIRSIALDRKDDPIIPVHLDNTRIPGWPRVRFSILLQRPEPREIANILLRVLDTRGSLPAPIRPWLQDLEKELTTGVLLDSELGREVLATLREDRELVLAKAFNLDSLIAAICAAENYCTLIRDSEFESDFGKCVTPILVAVAQSLARSACAQAAVVRLCDAIAKRVGLKLIWPHDAEESNELKNAIYSACLATRELESDRVLVELRGLRIVRLA